MERSTRDAWLTGPGDLAESEVNDVPAPGQSVKVRGLSAKYSAEIMSQFKLVQEGRSQVAKIDMPTMECLQFVHGVIDPTFTLDEARMIQERFGPAFKKVVAEIDRLSGIDKEAVEQVDQLFPGGRADATGDDGRDPGAGPVDDSAGGNGRPDQPVRSGS